MNKNYLIGFLAISIILVAAASIFGFAQSVSAQNYNYNYSCTYHAYRLCAGNNIFWYDSCGTQQDLSQSCYGTNMVCKYGQCVYQQPALPPVNTYVAHNKIACYSDNLYWYDSLGRTSGLYKTCADSNSCTQDSCAGGKCLNTLKCDGSTCVTGSPDYNNYCSTSNNNNNNNGNVATGLAVSFFVKQNPNSAQWQKAVQVDSNSQIYFMVSVVNNSTFLADNINVSANIPSEISMLGNLQVNGVPMSGDIISGVAIGSLAPATTKTITFEGKASAFTAQSTKQAIATSNASGVMQSDSVSINLNPVKVSASSVSSSKTTSGFVDFLKRWYLWILVGLVLIFLFVVVFRRLSNNE